MPHDFKSQCEVLGMEYVSEKLCNDRHQNTVKRLDKHSEEIDDLKAAVIKLTQLVEFHEKRINAETSRGNKFWQTKSFEWIVRTVCVIAVILTMAAVGINYFKEYLSVISK